MLSDTFKFVRLTRQSFVDQDSFRRLALGIALGMMIGLIPKDSLFAAALFLVLMISTANLLCALISTFAFSWIGYLLDGFTHKLGGLILTADQLESTWLWLYELPLMPWTRFNNTVVMGSFVLALVMFYPVYLISSAILCRWGAAIHRRISNNWIYRWLVAPPVSSQVEDAA